MKIEHIDREKHPPTVTGIGGEAWDITEHVPVEKRKASVACWVVFAPWSHPFWPYVCVSCIHLRAEDGLPPPDRKLLDATHEVVVGALDPTVPHDFADMRPGRMLRPLNYVGQFVAQTSKSPVAQDAYAESIIQKTVIEILEMKLNPDSDGTSQWVSRFGDHCLL